MLLDSFQTLSNFAIAFTAVVIVAAHILQLADQLDALAPHSWRGISQQRASVAESGQRSFATLIRSTPIRAKNITPAMLAEFDRRGFLIVQNAVPLSIVQTLREALALEFPDHEARTTANSAPLTTGALGAVWLMSLNTWMDVSAFSDFVLHEDSPIGSLVAQLLDARTVRLGGEAIQGVWPNTQHYVWHQDVAGVGDALFNVSTAASGKKGWHARDYPSVRIFMPIADMDILANDSGGSLELLPLDSPEDVRKCTKPDRCDVDASVVAPDLRLGDLILYSPLVWHRTQSMRWGKRVSYVATLFDPEAWPRFVRASGSKPCPLEWNGLLAGDMCSNDGSQPFFWDAFGLWAHCWDGTREEFHYNFEFPSAFTTGVGKSGSVCSPQVYPKPLWHEVEARRQGQVQNLAGPYAFKTRLWKHASRAQRVGERSLSFFFGLPSTNGRAQSDAP